MLNVVKLNQNEPSFFGQISYTFPEISGFFEFAQDDSKVWAHYGTQTEAFTEEENETTK